MEYEMPSVSCFAPSILHDLSGTWEQQDRSAESVCMALPGVQVPDDLYSHSTHPSEDDVVTRHRFMFLVRQPHHGKVYWTQPYPRSPRPSTN